MTGERFIEYVDEFRTFSRFHKVGCGQPHDLDALMLTVRSSDRFRAEMASMIRSMLFREREGLTQADLLRVVAVSWGGSDGMEASAELRGFLREVLSRPAGEPLAIPVEEELDSAVAEKSDPWAEGSLLQRELAKFAAWRAGQTLRRAS